MAAEDVCPTVEELRDYVSRSLGENAAAAIAAHLERCASCAAAVDGIARCDSASSVEAVTEAAKGSVSPPATLADERDTREWQPDEIGFDMNLLDRSSVEESLGRLGKYEILGVVGQGGMGIVFKALDEQLRRIVAVKVLKRELASNATSRRRFIREARAAAAVNHPNVVTIYAVDEHRGVPFLVMEMVNGRSLRDRIRAHADLEFSQLLRICAQIAQGLAAAHAQGVIHRDIKPSNIMLEDDVERVKITDFGLARVAIDNVELTSRELAVGTPAYMAPEQIAGEAVDGRSDLFGLGCVIHAMVVGHSPFHGRNALEMARKVESLVPVALDQLRPTIPPFFSEIATRLLEKDPDRRFQSAAELADLLTRHLHVLNQTPSDNLSRVMYQSKNDSPPAQQRPRRGRWLVAAAAIALAAIAGVVFWPDGTKTATNGAADSPGARAAAAGIAGGRVAHVRVAKSGSAPARTINSALQLVRRGGRITIEDDATYDETLLIAGAAAAGLMIEAPLGATLKHDSEATLLKIDGAARVTVRGLRLEAQALQHGIEVVGDCAGSVLEDLVVTQPDSGTRAAIYFHTGARGTPDAPIEVRRARITAVQGIAFVGAKEAPAAPVAHVACRECRYYGYGAEHPGICVGVAVHYQVHDVAFADSSFSRAAVGISLTATGPRQIDRLTVSGNAFHRCKFWLSATDATLLQNSLDQAAIRFAGNRLAAVGGLEVSADALPRIAGRWFTENVWETALSEFDVNRPAAAQVAQLVDSIPFLSRDPAADDYLKLPPPTIRVGEQP